MVSHGLWGSAQWLTVLAYQGLVHLTPCSHCCWVPWFLYICGWLFSLWMFSLLSLCDLHCFPQMGALVTALWSKGSLKWLSYQKPRWQTDKIPSKALLIVVDLESLFLTHSFTPKSAPAIDEPWLLMESSALFSSPFWCLLDLIRTVLHLLEEGVPLILIWWALTRIPHLFTPSLRSHSLKFSLFDKSYLEGN